VHHVERGDHVEGVRQPGGRVEDLVADPVGEAGLGDRAPGLLDRRREDGLHGASGTGADEVLDQQARAAYRQRLTALDEELAEAEAWHDTERASRLRAEKDFLVRELAAATGLGGRPRRLGAESERARLNVTRAIRSAIAKIRDRAPAAAAHLDRAVRTGTRCSYSPPDGPG
jgi:non-specific serine/threonine protein kinase